MKQNLAIVALSLCVSAAAQVNSGSNGSDGAFNPTTNIVINMADHPDGIYQYTSVNIPTNVTVTFIPNANNSPVYWLVQSNCVINGTIMLNGANVHGPAGAAGGPGGFRGGNAGGGGAPPGEGVGPGGGKASGTNWMGGNGSFGSVGEVHPAFRDSENRWREQDHPGEVYGNTCLVPLIGGSGGGGTGAFFSPGMGGAGGGGAILIAADSAIEVNGAIRANGGSTAPGAYPGGGGGSGGAIRLVASTLQGRGAIEVSGGVCNQEYYISYYRSLAGNGRVRLDALENYFVGSVSGEVSRGFQPIIIPTNGQIAQLTITSVGGVPVSASPMGVLSTPDAVLSAQQNNPIPIVVHCSNISLNTQITVSVKPANGAAVSATGLNSSGTLSSSTATVLINMPRGGGIIYATAATGN